MATDAANLCLRFKNIADFNAETALYWRRHRDFANARSVTSATVLNVIFSCSLMIGIAVF